MMSPLLFIPVAWVLLQADPNIALAPRFVAFPDGCHSTASVPPPGMSAYPTLCPEALMATAYSKPSRPGSASIVAIHFPVVGDSDHSTASSPFMVLENPIICPLLFSARAWL